MNWYNINLFTNEFFPWRNPRNWWHNIKAIPRMIRNIWQRAKYGVCNEDTWELYSFYSAMTVNAISKLAEAESIPSGMTQREWQVILNKIIDCFSYAQLDGSDIINDSEWMEMSKKWRARWKIVENDDGSSTYIPVEMTPAEQTVHDQYFKQVKDFHSNQCMKVKEGMDLLGMYFYDLWR